MIKIYTLSSFLTLNFTYILSILNSCISAQTSFPLGIYLGPQYITAAYTHPNGSTSPLASIKGSSSYQFIIAPPEEEDGGPNPALVPKILRTTFSALQSTIAASLPSSFSQTNDIVITLPNHLTPEISDAITKAAGVAGYVVLNVVLFTESVGWGYGFLPPRIDGEDGEGRRKDGDGDEDGGKGVSVLIDYNESGLEVWSMHHDSWTPKPEDHFSFPDLGAHALTTNPAPGDTATSTYLRTVQARLSAPLRKVFVREEARGEEQEREGDIDKILLSQSKLPLKEILLTGDASEAGMNVIKIALERVFSSFGLAWGGNGLVRRNEIEALYIGAVGAARRGVEMVMGKSREGEGEGGHGEL